MKFTYAERLEAGLLALGYKLVQHRHATSKYKIFAGKNDRSFRFVGKAGALRAGPNISNSLSLGDPSRQTPVYQLILRKGDDALAGGKPIDPDAALEELGK